MTNVRIKELPQHVGEKVTIDGWLYNKRTAGKLQFPIIRDGSGYLQCVVFKKEVSEETWKAADEVTQESSVRVTGTVRSEARAPGGVELGVELLEIVVNGIDEPLTARVREPVVTPPKSEIGIEIVAAEVLVFAASEA